MTTIHDWARDHGVSYAALMDLAQRLGAASDAPLVHPGMSEAGVDSRVRLAAQREGVYLWRNNVGACYDDQGNFIRYGLVNDSAKVNEVLKSGDRIGIRPVFITPEMIGTFIGQFVSREIKKGSWRYTGTDREVAQKNWCELITSLGGDAKFTNGSDL